MLDSKQCLGVFVFWIFCMLASPSFSQPPGFVRGEDDESETSRDRGAITQVTPDRIELQRGKRGFHVSVTGSGLPAVQKEPIQRGDKDAIREVLQLFPEVGAVEDFDFVVRGDPSDVPTINLIQTINGMDVAASNLITLNSDGTVRLLLINYVDPNQPNVDPSTWISRKGREAIAMQAFQAAGIFDDPKDTSDDLIEERAEFETIDEDMTVVPIFIYQYGGKGLRMNGLDGSTEFIEPVNEMTALKTRVCFATSTQQIFSCNNSTSLRVYRESTVGLPICQEEAPGLCTDLRYAMHIGLNEAEDYMSIVQPLWCCAPGTTASPIGKFISGNWQINIKSMLPLPVTQSIEALAEFDPNTDGTAADPDLESYTEEAIKEVMAHEFGRAFHFNSQWSGATHVSHFARAWKEGFADTVAIFISADRHGGDWNVDDIFTAPTVDPATGGLVGASGPIQYHEGTWESLEEHEAGHLFTDFFMAHRVIVWVEIGV